MKNSYGVYLSVVNLVLITTYLNLSVAVAISAFDARFELYCSRFNAL